MDIVNRTGVNGSNAGMYLREVNVIYKNIIDKVTSIRQYIDIINMWITLEHPFSDILDGIEKDLQDIENICNENKEDGCD